MQQLGGNSKAKCKATKSWATKSKATKSKATKSKAKSDTSPVTPELAAARLPFQKRTAPVQITVRPQHSET